MKKTKLIINDMQITPDLNLKQLEALVEHVKAGRIADFDKIELSKEPSSKTYTHRV